MNAMKHVAIRHSFGPIALSLCLLMGACKAKIEERGSTDTSASASTTPATPATGDTGSVASDTGAARAPAPAPAMSDGNIFAKLDATNTEEVEEGKLAQSKAKGADVKSFANMMVTDHSTMKKMGADLAKKLNITPTPPPNDNSKAMMDAMMQAMQSAPNFDSAYVAEQVTGHEKTLADLKSWLGMAQNDELKAMITGAIPKVQMHLEHAREVQGKMKK